MWWIAIIIPLWLLVGVTSSALYWHVFDFEPFSFLTATLRVILWPIMALMVLCNMAVALVAFRMEETRQPRSLRRVVR